MNGWDIAELIAICALAVIAGSALLTIIVFVSQLIGVYLEERRKKGSK